MLSCFFCFNDGETIYQFFDIVECGSHLVGAVKLILQLHKALSLQVGNEFLHLLLVGLYIRIEAARLFLQLDVAGELL